MNLEEYYHTLGTRKQRYSQELSDEEDSDDEEVEDEDEDV